MEFPTGLQIPQCIAAYLKSTAGEDSPNLYLDQLVSKVVTQGGFPTASPIAKTV